MGMAGMVEVFVLDEFKAWYEALTQEEQESIEYGVAQLEEKGVTLGFPLSSKVSSERFNLRELRIQHQGDPYRVLYAFDPKRQAVLIVGGNKKGDDRFYERLIPRAEKAWEEYLQTIG
jgi:hypothetical protein